MGAATGITGGKGALVLTPPKRGKVRTMPLPEVTSTALAAHIERYGATTVRCECCGTDNAVLLAERGRLVAHHAWDGIWHAAVTAAGLTPSRTTGLHQLRHAYASVLIDGGATPKQVQSYMGHKSITTTVDVYGHLFERSADKARAVIDHAFTKRDQRRASSGDV